MRATAHIWWFYSFSSDISRRGFFIYFFLGFSYLLHSAPCCLPATHDAAFEKAEVKGKMIYMKIWKWSKSNNFTICLACYTIGTRERLLLRLRNTISKNWWVIFASVPHHIIETRLLEIAFMRHFFLLPSSISSWLSFHFVQWHGALCQVSVLKLFPWSVRPSSSPWLWRSGMAVRLWFSWFECIHFVCAYSTPGDTAIIYIF